MSAFETMSFYSRGKKKKKGTLCLGLSPHRTLTWHLPAATLLIGPTGASPGRRGARGVVDSVSQHAFLAREGRRAKAQP